MRGTIKHQLHKQATGSTRPGADCLFVEWEGSLARFSRIFTAFEDFVQRIECFWGEVRNRNIDLGAGGIVQIF